MPKPAADAYKKFSAWLDAELEQALPESGGVYFDLFEPAEDGFGVYFCITERFDADDDDWACNVQYSAPQMHMVATSGRMEWEAALSTAETFIRKYAGIGTAFSDGDIVYIDIPEG